MTGYDDKTADSPQSYPSISSDLPQSTQSNNCPSNRESHEAVEQAEEEKQLLSPSTRDQDAAGQKQESEKWTSIDGQAASTMLPIAS